MAIICPTVTPTTLEEYGTQLATAVGLSKRIHLDFMDGEFAPTLSPALADIWSPAGVAVDLHIMYKRPTEHIETIVKLRPRLVIIHAEASGDFPDISHRLKEAGIQVGVALLKDTPVERIRSALGTLDHVLVFSGDLGHFGGVADLELINKVRAIKRANPSIEVGWDGGINDKNTPKLIEGGVDVLNVGGFIQRSANPAHAYATLKAVALQISRR